MGRSVTPKYRVEVSGSGCNMTPFCWNGKQDGRANQKNLDAWRERMNASFQPGGTNWHVSEAFNSVPHISTATLIRQRDDEVVAVSKAPMFEVVA